MHNLISEILNVILRQNIKLLDQLCNSCIHQLDEYHKIQIKLGILRVSLQEAYQRGKELERHESNTQPTFLLIKEKDNNMVLRKIDQPNFIIGNDKNEVFQLMPSQLMLSEGTDEMLEIVEDHENYEELIVSGQKENSFTESNLYEKQDDIFFCKICDNNSIGFDSKSIETHLEKEHCQKIHMCHMCGISFYDDLSLKSHENDLHSELPSLIPLANKGWNCPECDKSFHSKRLLEEHKLIHAGARPFKCPEKNCGKDFSSKYTLTSHMKIHTTRERNFKCDLCEKSFYHSQNLIQHLKLHSEVKEFICTDCDKAFSTQHNLDVHKIVHTKIKSFICRFCEKAFARRAEVRDHERTHTGEKPFKCEMCDVSFAQRSNLLSHKRATHLNDKRHKCELCDRAFKRRRLLDYHIRSMHTGERPYSCKLCKATFVYPEHYKKHQRIHTGQKPYVCEICQKSFTSKDNLKAHTFVHSDQKPYECPICSVGFMRKPLLLQHMEKENHLMDHFFMNQPKFVNDTIELEKTIVSLTNKNDDDGDDESKIIDEDEKIQVVEVDYSE